MRITFRLMASGVGDKCRGSSNVVVFWDTNSQPEPGMQLSGEWIVSPWRWLCQ